MGIQVVQNQYSHCFLSEYNRAREITTEMNIYRRYFFVLVNMYKLHILLKNQSNFQNRC